MGVGAVSRADFSFRALADMICPMQLNATLCTSGAAWRLFTATMSKHQRSATNFTQKKGPGGAREKRHIVTSHCATFKLFVSFTGGGRTNRCSPDPTTGLQFSLLTVLFRSPFPENSPVLLAERKWLLLLHTWAPAMRLNTASLKDWVVQKHCAPSTSTMLMCGLMWIQ